MGEEYLTMVCVQFGEEVKARGWSCLLDRLGGIERRKEMLVVEVRSCELQGYQCVECSREEPISSPCLKRIGV